ncbi:MAG: RagB/SusD family nutrient uptake outer membrane protein [Dysgonamonadaceae bacterium]|jgi:hypothetical protein|nr:RagB/SusD family nutrient uptake outer membrane protein [Dysgonamonadaceae bacterium]
MDRNSSTYRLQSGLKESGIFLLLLCLLLSACEDLLDPKVETRLTENFATISYNNTLARSIALYTYLPDGLSYIDGAMMASASDEAEHTLETALIQKFNAGSWNAIDNPDNGAWNRNFQGIYSVNLFLTESDSVNLDYLKSDPTESVQQDYRTRLENIKRWKYEARFLRAFYYFELIKRYGGVPLITEPVGLDYDFASVKRDSLSKCIQFIVSECDSAAANLPSRTTDPANNLGRAIKGSALGLKCRTLLYAASDLFNSPGQWAAGYAHPELIALEGKSRQERWEEAAAACFEFIREVGSRYPLGDYEATADYLSGEIILCRRYAASNAFEKANYPVGYDLGQSGTTPSQNQVDAYEMKDDGTPFDWNNPFHQADPYANRDPRLALSILTNNAKFKGRPVEAWTGGREGKGVTWGTKTGYFLLKYVNPELNLLQNRTSVHVWVIMRYSEILLNYAEAMNEAFGPNNNNGYSMTALRAINQVRNRVEMPLIPNSITKEELRERIRNERRVELAFEDHRIWDVRRWMIAPETLGAPLRGVEITKKEEGVFNYEPIEVEKRVFTPQMYLYPIPQADLNITTWAQNPGW